MKVINTRIINSAQHDKATEVENQLAELKMENDRMEEERKVLVRQGKLQQETLQKLKEDT